ncbi:hypothetical protein D5086_023151 [Populus alba]|uniref:Uncharacterized protein n=1 Tax=Populus alba TaxID=43335 RepID=A0ACC4B9M9_POPAL
MAQTKTVSEPRRNLTLETLPLNYTNLDLTLRFYFNCTTNLFSEPPIDCLRFKEKQSYVIVLTVNETDQVNWLGICKENSRTKLTLRILMGTVGINNTRKGFLCFCKDVKSTKQPLSSSLLASCSCYCLNDEDSFQDTNKLVMPRALVKESLNLIIKLFKM